MTVDNISFAGWSDCVRIRNDEIEIVATTNVGPRIVFAGYRGGQNFFHLVHETRGSTGGDQWKIYGGHRLWLAPENIPLSFYPDNDPVTVRAGARSVTLTQNREKTTGLVKEMEIGLPDSNNCIEVIHRIYNTGSLHYDVAVWALSVLSPKGRVIVPQEPYGEGDDYLLPARSLALWQYTRMNDRRWIWGDRYIQAKHDAALTSEQKIGITNKEKWAACYLDGEVLIKEFPYDPSATYTDLNSNNEIYINGSFLELETLGPLTTLHPGDHVEHAERWMFAKATVGEDEADIDAKLLPLVNSFLKK